MEKYVKSFIRNSTEFLNYIPSKVSPDSIVVFYGAKSLYSNITHELGLEAIEYWLDKHPEDLPTRINKDFIKQGMKFILENNNFFFNGKYFNQVKGIAMGTKGAPIYPTLVLGFLEENLYDVIEENFSREFREYFEIGWCRYLDDCFIIMNGNL